MIYGTYGTIKVDHNYLRVLQQEQIQYLILEEWLIINDESMVYKRLFNLYNTRIFNNSFTIVILI